MAAPNSQITLQHALDRADTASTSGHVKRSLMLGGVSSLMYNLQLVLRDTNDCLQKVEELQARILVALYDFASPGRKSRVESRHGHSRGKRFCQYDRHVLCIQVTSRCL